MDWFCPLGGRTWIRGLLPCASILVLGRRFRCRLASAGGLREVTLDCEDTEAIAELRIQPVEPAANRVAVVSAEFQARQAGAEGMWIYPY